MKKTLKHGRCLSPTLGDADGTGLRWGPDIGICSKSTWYGPSELPGCELPLWGVGLFLGNGTSQKSPNLSEHHLETRTITSFKTDKSAVLQSSHKWLFANIPKAWMVIMLNINIVIFLKIYIVISFPISLDFCGILFQDISCRQKIIPIWFSPNLIPFTY